MRAADGMHVEWVDDEAVVLDAETGKLHYLNPPVALFYALVLEHGFETALDTLKQNYAGQPMRDEELSQMIEQMSEGGLLIDD
jgi:hypothetical protein